MNTEEKIFTGGLNTDDSYFALKPNQYRNAINVRMLSTQNGKAMSVQNTVGNKAVGDTTALGTGTNRCIGSYEDEKNGRLYQFIYNSEGHHFIRQYDKTTDATTILLTGDLFDKTGLNKGLNFDRASLVTAVDKVGDMLFWTDPVPRRINIARLLSGQYKTFNDDLISIIRRPPNLPPVWFKSVSGALGSVSLTKNSAFQFAWRFVYYDGETSALSPYSTIANYGADNDASDTILVYLPSENAVPDDARFVELAVRFGNTGGFFIIKRWDKDIQTDAVRISQHNGGLELEYDFFNDVLGEAIADADAVKPFENVPLTSKSLVAVDNRIFLGNNKSGYDTPATTSLTATTHTSTIDVNGKPVTGQWWVWRRSYHKGFVVHHYYAWLLSVTGYDGIKDGAYAITGVNGSEKPVYTTDNLSNSWFSYPQNINYSNMNFAGLTWGDVKDYYQQPDTGTSYWNAVTDHIPNTSNVIGAPTQTTFKSEKIFKTGTTYQLGMVFYDRYMRSSAVVTNDSLKVKIGQTAYNNETFTNLITWSITNSNALSEIPDWAEYYSVVMTKNLRTRFFMQTFPYEISYVSKDADGVYQPKKEAYDPTFAGIQIDLTSLSRDNLGYVFNKGDIVNLYLDGKSVVSLSVIGQYGKYIVCNLTDLGDLTTTPAALMELYTPYKASTIEPFWEIGQIFQIVNPGTGARAYGTLTGSIQGDTWIVARKFSAISTNGVEAMSPNDKYYQNWWTDAGRPNTVPQPGIGQTTKETDIIFSDPYIPNTLVNGLCSFGATNSKTLADSCGPIRKLVYTSKVQGELGGVMLALCENETVSIYIGQTELQTQSADTFLAASPGVIGTVNPLKGSFGTINPESVAKKQGNVYFLDRKNGKVIRYASNGLYPISDYNMRNFFDTRCKALNSLTDADIANLGIDGVYCYGGFDDYNGEYLLFMPKVREDTDFLEDITRDTPPFSTNFGGKQPNYHDFDDGGSKVLGFKEGYNLWASSFAYEPEYFGAIGSMLYSFKEGKLYSHDGPYNTFYGKQFPSILSFIVNGSPTAPKIFQSLSIDASQSPDYLHIRTEITDDTPYHQSSDLMKADFTVQEGRLYAPFYFDRLSPNASGTYEQKMMTGDQIRGQIGMVFIEFDEYSKAIEVKAIGVNYGLSAGHV